MKLNLKRLKDNLPITKKKVSKRGFRCRNCNKLYPDWLLAYKCPCQKKVKWNTPNSRNKNNMEEFYKFYENNPKDYYRAKKQTEKHKQLIKLQKLEKNSV